MIEFNDYSNEESMLHVLLVSVSLVLFFFLLAVLGLLHFSHVSQVSLSHQDRFVLSHL